jgi:hypothetical protein
MTVRSNDAEEGKLMSNVAKDQELNARARAALGVLVDEIRQANATRNGERTDALAAALATISAALLAHRDLLAEIAMADGTDPRNESAGD